MSTLAAGGAQGATQPLLLATTPDGVLAAYADHGRGLAIGPDAKRIRCRAAERLLGWHPDLASWMARPTPARLADLGRSGAWTSVTCLVPGRGSHHP